MGMLSPLPYILTPQTPENGGSITLEVDARSWLFANDQNRGRPCINIELTYYRSGVHTIEDTIL